LNKNIYLKALDNPWIELVARWILGATFVYASYHKILSPAEFAKILYGYALFPGDLINLIAIVLPFVELISGICLISGFYPRSAALIVNGLLVLFITAITINLIRGHEFDCGCFSAGDSKPSNLAGLMLARNYFLLFVSFYILRFKREKLRVLSLVIE